MAALELSEGKLAHLRQADSIQIWTTHSRKCAMKDSRPRCVPSRFWAHISARLGVEHQLYSPSHKGALSAFGLSERKLLRLRSSWLNPNHDPVSPQAREHWTPKDRVSAWKVNRQAPTFWQSKGVQPQPPTMEHPGEVSARQLEIA